MTGKRSGAILCTAMLGLALAAGPVAGAAPISSLRPIPRPVAPPEPVVVLPTAPKATIRPRPRVAAEAPVAEVAVETAEAPTPADTPEAGDTAGVQIIAASVQGVSRSLRPVPRGAKPRVAPEPARVVQVSSAAVVVQSMRPRARPDNIKRVTAARAAGAKATPAPIVPVGKAGKICGDRKIRGQKLSPIAGRIKGCGVPDPVRVSSIDGVALTTPAIMDCNTAKALKTWVNSGVKPAVGRLGGGVSSLKVAAHYACRTRNNQAGAKISEHGKGRAIDISAINLKNGVSITVLKGWNDKQQGKMLKSMHKAACGPFGTVLGPNSDRFHKDHFHFDTARYRSGTYCR